MGTTLLDLPEDVFLIILSNCDKQDVCQLRLTCTTIKGIVDIWLSIQAKQLLATNLKHEYIQSRSAFIFNTIDKFRIAYNWMYGRYQMDYTAFTKIKCMPWMQLTKDSVWLSSNKAIKKYTRNPQKVQANSFTAWNTPEGSEVNKFVYRNNQIITAESNGYLSIWAHKENTLTILKREKIDETPVNGVDEQNGIVVFGSNNGLYGVYSLTENEEIVSKTFQNTLPDCIWTVVMDTNKAAIGTRGFLNEHSLYILDLESTTMFHKLGKSGVFGIKWETPNILFACGYNSYINKWDLRIPTSPVQTWQDPFQEAVYCIETDNNCTFVTGAQHYARMVLWDSRSKKYQQLYYLKNKQRYRSGSQTIRSPIYSLSFDAGQLFAVTDQRLYTLDFTIKNGLLQNFRYMGVSDR